MELKENMFYLSEPEETSLDIIIDTIQILINHPTNRIAKITNNDDLQYILNKLKLITQHHCPILKESIDSFYEWLSKLNGIPLIRDINIMTLETMLSFMDHLDDN